MKHYIIEVSNEFDAESPIDALAQFITWIDENAYHAGYRVFDEDGTSVFVDADDLTADDFTRAAGATA